MVKDLDINATDNMIIDSKTEVDKIMLIEMMKKK